ncbi:unnamed protein product, partial [Mesorhabditis belari]|uniref:EIPR1-like beta-propeller domain-containing protein n=1 Tax=Mesorhabditis belari TaxID=2138241 RepID=A0AAF3J3Q5_9BILA
MTIGECLMYGLDFEAQSLVPVVADEENVRFLVGTRNIKMDNQISLLTVKSDDGVISAQSYTHPIGEISALAASPKDAHIFATASSDNRIHPAKHSLNIYRFDHDHQSLDELSTCSFETPIQGLEWSAQSDELACFSANTLYTLSAVDRSITKNSTLQQNGRIRSLRFDPHSNGRTIGLCVEKDVLGVETRSKTTTFHLPETHMFRALTLDFNPNLPNCLATGGDDGVIRIWDTRQPKTPIHCVKAHSHWITMLRYHPDHDQLLLSGSSDSCVILTCAQSVSSEVKLTKTEDEDEVTEQLPDGELDRIIEHEDTVCAVQWSTAEPWTYASLSFDGRVVVSRVSRQHKYTLMQL